MRGADMADRRLSRTKKHDVRSAMRTRKSGCSGAPCIVGVFSRASMTMMVSDDKGYGLAVLLVRSVRVPVVDVMERASLSRLGAGLPAKSAVASAQTLEVCMWCIT